MPGVPTDKGDRYRSEILEYVREYRTALGFAPSMTEISEQIGLARSSCLHHINVLAERGLLTYLAGDPSRTISLTAKGRKAVIAEVAPKATSKVTPIRPVKAASSTRRARRSTH